MNFLNTLNDKNRWFLSLFISLCSISLFLNLTLKVQKEIPSVPSPLMMMDYIKLPAKKKIEKKNTLKSKLEFPQKQILYHKVRFMELDNPSYLAMQLHSKRLIKKLEILPESYGPPKQAFYEKIKELNLSEKLWKLSE